LGTCLFNCRLIKTLAVSITVSIFYIHSWAARPMNTDDANIVDYKSCQVESWYKKNQNNSEFWSIPGCNFGNDIEWSLGGVHQTAGSSDAANFWLGQVKKRWIPVQDGQWGISSTVGTIRSTNNRNVSTQDNYINIPLTQSLFNNRFIHINVGGVHHVMQGTTQATWGLGLEYPLSSQLILISESFGEKKTASKYQVGLRFWIVPQRLQLDTTYGNAWQGTQQDRWMTIGLRVLTAPFLP